ncbi:hypothetical protein BO85DRAFT_80736 [Aspergillus piperis CBS 112811]|uniref:Uncharacterized protein n=1 Tax=Aspergillus piperis CBS 112811 TaxID=1448313 RepID=A0A8G1QWY2_9EURO|nr:hypothetical protein BO85DRAFT_80736 [Aspergillus piperis CBS 112811]RAH55158.1 hypothetical protein BO85DRAFT_80736 [Aspergillus piperis CBS 112811]
MHRTINLVIVFRPPSLAAPGSLGRPCFFSLPFSFFLPLFLSLWILISPAATVPSNLAPMPSGRGHYKKKKQKKEETRRAGGKKKADLNDLLMNALSISPGLAAIIER